MSKHVSDIPALIEELGGLAATARFFGEQPQTVWNWRARNQMPSRLFAKHTEALDAQSISAPASLWGQERPTQQERVA